MNWNKRLLSLIAVLGIVAIAIWALLPKPVTVQLATVTRGSFQQIVEEDGKTRVRERYVVSAPLMGKLQRINLKAGDPIQANQVIAAIVPSAPALLDVRSAAELKARADAAQAHQAAAATTVARAQAALDKSRTDLTRAKALAAIRSISLAQLEDAELAVKLNAKELEASKYGAIAAQHDVTTARAALMQSSNSAAAGKAWQIISPVTGKVLKVDQESESVVTMGAPLVEIGNAEDLEIVVDVLSSDATLIRPGAIVNIRDGGQATSLQGRVRRVEPSAFTKISALGVEEQRVNIIIDLTSPAALWKNLGDGYKVDVKIIVFSTDNAIKVPVSALFRNGEQWAVFVAEAGRAKLRQVQIARRSGLEAMLVKGLQPGEKVIIYPGDMIKPDVRISTN
ncbi:MAG: HlyD family efflux transporter periplasmic adaptor subunit [Sulfuriferula sp.]